MSQQAEQNSFPKKKQKEKMVLKLLAMWGNENKAALNSISLMREWILKLQTGAALWKPV